jgi:Domain of unknown function (DUF4920)
MAGNNLLVVILKEYFAFFSPFLCEKSSRMKHLFMVAFCFLFAIIVYAQDPAPAEKGVTYGAVTTAEGAIAISDLDKNVKDNQFSGKVTGKVVEVCQEKGCWMKVEKSNGEKMLVRFKDYGFFMPKNIVGKEVVLDGEAKVKEMSVKQLQHYAKDAGKSEEEIKKIKEPKKELQFIAKGVLVL